jgi:hypothetical protein
VSTKKVAATPPASKSGAAHKTPQKAEGKKPPQSAPSTAAHQSIPKPSAAIAKQQTNSSPNQ